MGSQQKKKKRTKDTRSMVSEIKRAQDLDQNRLAIQPTFELGYSPAGINMIDFVNVSTAIGPSQGQGAAPPPPPDPTLLLHLDGNFTDASGSANIGALSPGFTNSGNGYVTPGQFGSSALRLSTPTDGTPSTIDFIGITHNTSVSLNLSIGFSISFWVYPTDITSAGPAKRSLFNKKEGTVNDLASIVFDSAGVIYFFVKKAGTDYKREKSGLVASSWQHICAVFNGTANTLELYRNGIAGTASAAATQYYSTQAQTPSNIEMGIQTNSTTNTHYEGYIDEVQFYQVVLTSTQVTNLMNTNAP